MRFDRFGFVPQLIQARWEFGKLASEEVPPFAQNALELGYDGKYTRRIAGLTQPTNSDLQPLMPRFLAELGINKPTSRENAAFVLARYVAQGIIDGRVQPYEGARFISREIADELGQNLPDELIPFIGYASDYEDCVSYSGDPADRRGKIDRDIIENARILVTALAR